MTEKTPTCALVATSDFNVEDFCSRDETGAFDCVVAVDGGLAHLKSIGRAADYILGDFDSLGYVPEGANVIVHPAHKDKSDLELALDYVAEKGFSQAIVYGALGGRLDHTVAALQTCARFAEAGIDVELVGVDCVVSILVGPGRLVLPATNGIVSVFSAVEESYGVYETGMEYPLAGATLTNRTSLGLSNTLIGQPACISVERGTLFIFRSTR